MTRAAIDARAFPRDKRQTNDNYFLELLPFADWLGYTIYKAYCD